MSEPESITIDDAAVALLEATETIHAALLGDGDLDLLAPAYEARESVFARLQGIWQEGSELSAAARACIDRVRELDQAILALGDAQRTAVQGEQHALTRRRAVIQAHAVRERDEPRLITLKA